MRPNEMPVVGHGPHDLGACPLCGFAVLELAYKLPADRCAWGTIHPAPRARVKCALGHEVSDVAVEFHVSAPSAVWPRESDRRAHNDRRAAFVAGMLAQREGEDPDAAWNKFEACQRVREGYVRS